MAIYADKLTGDELVSDAFTLFEMDGAIVEVDSDFLTTKGSSGENEEDEEELATDDVKEISIVSNFRLQRITHDKGTYLEHINGYMKELDNKLGEEGYSNDKREDIRKKMNARLQMILINFNHYTFYIGESMDPQGMVVLLGYRSDGVTPYFTYWKHGLAKQQE